MGAGALLGQDRDVWRVYGKRSNDWHPYPADECPVYGILDWHAGIARNRTIVIGIILMFFIVPSCECSIWCCVRGRRSADSNGQQESKPGVRVSTVNVLTV